MTEQHSILAQQVNRGGRGLTEALNEFFSSPLGEIVGYFLDLVALFLIGLGLWLILKALKAPNPASEILKKALWPFLGVPLVLSLSWTTSVNGIFESLIKAFFDSVSTLVPGL